MSQIIGKVLAVISYSIALVFGLLCVLYHFFFIGLSYQQTGHIWPYLFGYGGLLLLANSIYPIAILVMLTSRSWRTRIYKPEVWLVVLLTIPVLMYLNYGAVNLLTPYDYNL